MLFRSSADVLVYNLRPQAMARLGLLYEDLRQINAGLIYVGGYGFSEAGPYAGRPAYDDLIQGMTGMAWLSAKASGGEPRYVPTTLFDRIVGLHIVYAVTAALYRRTVAGTGQAVEVPMFEAIAEMVLEDHMGGRTFEPPTGPSGYDRVLAEGRRPYRTQDGYLCVLIYNDRQWERFFSIVGKAAAWLATDSVAMLPPAPVLFSTTTGCPSCTARRCATTLVMVSMPPPAPCPTTMRMGLAGKAVV